jgi:hypothetical protein
MSFERTRYFTALAAFLFAFASTIGSASAAGSISYSKREVQESGGGWHLMMMIVYGGKPNTAHVPMRFTFTPIGIYENYLDDAHGEKPQKRNIPLVGQVGINESVDVDFADSSGKLFNRTRFDFTVTRAHGFSAGEYSVVVHRADGAQVGTSQTLVLLGDNPVIDRRTISFVGTGKKDKPAAPTSTPAADSKAAAAPAGEPAGTAAAATAPAAGAPGEAAADPAAGDPAAAEKVPPSSRGCGCELTSRAHSGAWSSLAGLLALAFCRLRRSRLPL